MTRRAGVSVIAVFLIMVGFSCAKPTWYIPEYDTPREQYLYAIKLRSELPLTFARERLDEKLRHTVAALHTVIERFPNDEQYTPLAYLSLADMYTRLKEHKQALKYFSQTIEKYPNEDELHAAALYGQARSYERLGKPEKAFQSYKTCIDLFETHQSEDVQRAVQACKQRYETIGL